MIHISDALDQILTVLQSIGARPILVGGCVRDAILGDVNPKDIDIEVYGVDYQKIQRALKANGINANVFGKSFGVLKIRVGDEDFDISLPRTELKTGQGHREFQVNVDPDMTFEQASLRRDFTINAIGWDPFKDRILDPHGGRYHLEISQLVHVSDQFAEDPLRVLRGMQFAGRFSMTMHPSTIIMCYSLRNEFNTISVERIWNEWEKFMLKSTVPSAGLKVLQHTCWLNFFPELKALIGVKQDPRWHPEGDVWVHTCMALDQAAQDSSVQSAQDRLVTMFGTLCHDLGKPQHTQFHSSGKITSYGHAAGGVEPSRAFLNRIGAPDWLKAKVLPIVKEHMCAMDDNPTARNVRRLARRLNNASVQEWARVVQADRNGRGVVKEDAYPSNWVNLAEQENVETNSAKPILKGEMLIEAGLRPGPVFKQIINDSIVAQDDGMITDEESAKRWLTQYLKESS